MDEISLEFDPVHISIIDEDLEDRLRILSRNAFVSFVFKGSRLTIVAKDHSSADLLNSVCRTTNSDFSRVGTDSILISPSGDRLSYIFKLGNEGDVRLLHRRLCEFRSNSSNSSSQSAQTRRQAKQLISNGPATPSDTSSNSTSSTVAIPVTEHDYTESTEHLGEGGPLDGAAGDVLGDSVFSNRTDPSSAEQYFQFYSLLSQQQNMLQDYVRTGTYQRAILTNTADFRDKVVLDVGAGSGILSFFAVQAGARRVYAVEASSVAKQCEALVAANRLAGRIVVLSGKIEELELPEKVDVVISEPMGYMLFNERMLESYLHAKKWLRTASSESGGSGATDGAASATSNPECSPTSAGRKRRALDPHDRVVASAGQMFPSAADLLIVPFSDEALFMEISQKANFWFQQNFHGVDLSSLREPSMKEYFKQPVVDTFDVRVCVAAPLRYSVNFLSAHEKDLHRIDVPLQFTVLQTCTLHGLAFWFEVCFGGTTQSVWLSTSPTEPLTHWYQIRCLLTTPLFVQQGQTVRGRVLMRANMRQSYDVDIELTLPGSAHTSRNSIDLKNPLFRYTGQPVVAPPGSHTASPSDTYWNSLQTGIATVNAAGDANANAVAGGVNMSFQMSQFNMPASLANYTSANNQQLFTNGLALPVQVMNGVPMQYSGAQVVQPGTLPFVPAAAATHVYNPSDMAMGLAQFPMQVAAGWPELQVGANQEVVTSPPAGRVVSANGQHVRLARAGRSSSAYAGGLRQPQPSGPAAKHAISPTAADSAGLAAIPGASSPLPSK